MSGNRLLFWPFAFNRNGLDQSLRFWWEYQFRFNSPNRSAFPAHPKGLNGLIPIHVCKFASLLFLQLFCLPKKCDHDCSASWFQFLLRIGHHGVGAHWGPWQPDDLPPGLHRYSNRFNCPSLQLNFIAIWFCFSCCFAYQLMWWLPTLNQS